jgi:hypothetical protein
MRGPVLILCAAALLAGCGGDDEDTVVETTTVTTTETTPTTATPTEPVATVPGPGDLEDNDTSSGGDNGAAEAPSHCGRISFNASTDSGASGITAVGTDCETARTIARAARNATDDLRYEAEGFTCAGTRSENAGLASMEWFCVGADREVVSFVTT